MRENDVLNRFHQIKVLTIDQIVELLGSSNITARRYLNKWEAFTSFNHNGRYYTLPRIPEFDKNGIWKYQTILFSKYGNLKKTIIELIRGAEAGLSARQVAQIVEIRSNSSIFSQLQNVCGIRREKHEGCFVYFSDEQERYQEQKSALFGLKSAGFPSDEEAVVILVQYIKHPHIDIEELSRILARQGKIIAPSAVRSFLEHHELLKKTVDTGQ